MKQPTSLKLLLVSLSLLTISAYGDDYEDGYTAYGKKDYQTAQRLLEKSCEADNKFACHTMGIMHQYGKAKDSTDKTALAYYDKACEMGENLACFSHIELSSLSPVCSLDELSFTNDSRYFKVDGDNMFPLVFVDGKSVEIDKENQTVKYTTVSIASQEGRKNYIEFYGELGNCTNFGYNKTEEIIDYKNKKFTIKVAHSHNCDGSIVSTHKADIEWMPYGDDSVSDTIIKRYNLK